MLEKKLMAQKLDIPTGMRFGRLSVTGELDPHRSQSGSVSRIFTCSCDCGNIVTVDMRHLRDGHTKSCGCYRAEVTRERHTTHGHTANRDQSVYYDLWQTIKSKVVSRTHASAKHYPHVSMYAPWIPDFESFYNYIITTLGPRPEGHSLDRINNAGSYEPGNLRWATQQQQTQNTRRNRYLTLNGETKVLSQWAREIGISPQTLSNRIITYGWSVEKALTVRPGLRGRRAKP